MIILLSRQRKAAELSAYVRFFSHYKVFQLPLVDDYRGKQLRFSGDVKVERVEQQAGLYIRTNKQGERLRTENVARGTYDWMRYEVTISVAEDATFIRFGLVLYGKRQIWLANARLEVIEQGGMLSA